jgi:phosphatidate phosphatase APP1
MEYFPLMRRLRFKPLLAFWGLALAMNVSTHAVENFHTIVDDAWVGAQGAHFSGRLTEMRLAPTKEAGRWSSLYRTTRMLFTSGEEGVVSWRVGALEWSVRVDDHGYWELASNVPLGLAPGWHEIEAVPSASSPAGVLVPDPRNTLGIISDIDDTILVSEVLSKRRLLSNSLTVPAEQRAAVPGIATLYHQLAAKNPAPESTPIFYVSGSPRQLTDNLRRFLTAGGFPRGVLQLKEISTERGDSLNDTPAFKHARIEAIFAAFPGVKFMLIGDDGEQDPEIFSAVAEKFPERVEGIWIRRVHTDAQRARFPGQRDLTELLPVETTS